MSKSDSQKKDRVKAKPVTSPAELLKNLNLMFDQLQALEASGKGDPHVEKYIRVFVDTSYHGFKKAVEKIRTQNPAIKETPADSNDPREYFRNVHRWGVGQLYWENGERIGETPAETGMSTTDKEPSKELDKVEAGSQGYPGPRRQVPTSDADRQRAYRDGYTVDDWKPDIEQYIVPSKESAEKDRESKNGEKAKGSMLKMTVWSSKDNWEAIKSEYGISKRDFGKKINFVSNSFKRKIIFRDVEHAFVLASEGFAKPAVILAGGVIEELLRLYLKHKKIVAAGNTFNEYIKACKQNKLLQAGIENLSDSAREFRNFVHLSKEITKKHSITKAAAKGAVSSIFIIANDL